jgi:hypothetical protein
MFDAFTELVWIYYQLQGSVPEPESSKIILVAGR